MTKTREERNISPRLLPATAFAGMFGFGIVMALLGAVLPLLANRLHFDLRRAGDLFLVMNGAMLATSLALGPVLDRFGHKLPLIVAPLFVATALCILPAINSFEALIVTVLLLGIGGGGLNQATNTLISDLGSDVRRKSAGLNLLGVFFGFGALFVPFTVGSALRTLGFRGILYLAMVLSLTPVLLGSLSTFPVPHRSTGTPAAEILHLFRQPLLLSFAFLLFFESGNEFILGGYITTYLTTVLRFSVATASYILAAYWASLMLGRMILSRAALRICGEQLVRGSAAAVAASLALFVIAHTVVAASLCIVLLGLSTAAIFPTVLGLAGAKYADRSGTVFGILMAIALSGGMTLPWLLGRIAQDWGIRRAIFLVILDALAIFCLQTAADNFSGKRKCVTDYGTA